MRKKSFNKKLIILLFISVLFILGVVFIKHEKAISPNLLNKNSIKTVDENKNVNNSNETNQLLTAETKPAGTVDLKNLSMPVLMYHHIRILDDPNDKIGTNLSVAPNKLVEQLDFIKSKDYETITFEDIAANKIPSKSVILTFDDGYKNFYENAFPELKKRNMKAVVFIITGDIGDRDNMSSSEIKEISQYGIEIGDHTISHPDLTKIPKEKTQKEITESKKTLEALTGKPVISFCYPSGKFNSEVEGEVKNAGYSYATTTIGGITSFGNLFELNRYRVNKDTSITKYFQ